MCAAKFGELVTVQNIASEFKACFPYKLNYILSFGDNLGNVLLCYDVEL